MCAVPLFCSAPRLTMSSSTPEAFNCNAIPVRSVGARALMLAGALALVASPVSVVFAQTPASVAATPQGPWKAARAGSLRSLSYDATASLLGKATPITVKFYRDPTNTRTEAGFLGVDVVFRNVAQLKPFHFDDFEGPDATTQGKKPMRVTLTRKDKPALTASLDVSGSVPDNNQFVIGFGQESRQKSGFPLALLQALADGAESVQFTITNPRDAKLKLDFTVPVAGTQAQFRTLFEPK